MIWSPVSCSFQVEIQQSLFFTLLYLYLNVQGDFQDNSIYNLELSESESPDECVYVC